MNYTTSTLKLRDGLNVYLHNWKPEKPIKLLFLIHGSVEHAKRYDEFARILNKNGYLVVAPDHRGHGLTAKESGVFSDFGSKNGFLRVIDDLEEILDFIIKKYPNLPRYIFGHSLGSFMTRNLISIRGNDFEKVIISGSTWGNLLELKSGIILSKIWGAFAGRNKANQKYNDFLWKMINNKVKGNKGTLDFINRNEQEVEKYIADPLNGNTMTIEFGIQMSVAILLVRKDVVFENTPKNLKLLLTSGTDDPLANGGKDIKIIADKYKENGVKDVTIKLYEGARHEIINELNKEEVITDMINWLEQS
jgi:alpha-beta hydrolase superfamily lysophospholipase